MSFIFLKLLFLAIPETKEVSKKVGYTEYGYPICPNDSSLAMKQFGIIKEKGRSNRVKWGYPRNVLFQMAMVL